MTNPMVSDVVDLASDDVALADRMNAGKQQILDELRKVIVGQQEVIDQVLERSPQPAYLVLKGDIVAALGQQSAARLLHQDAVGRVVDPTKQSVWSLGWLTRCARSLGHEDLVQRFREASAAQIEAEEDSVLQGALLPERGDGNSEMRAAA